jgi:hypothetical protein
MSFSLHVTIDDGISGPLQRLGQATRSPEVRKVIGRAVANDLRQHFSKLDQERPNQMGGRRTHFYGQARRSVQNPVLLGDAGVSVSINHVGVAQRYFGGTIYAQPGKALSIPARAESYGRRPGEFTDLHLEVFKSLGLAALVQNDQTSISIRKKKGGGRSVKRGEEQGGGVFFWLVKRVTQDADPSVLPTDAELQEAASTAGLEYFSTLIARINDGRN